jgi:hypothetical protein
LGRELVNLFFSNNIKKINPKTIVEKNINPPHVGVGFE